MQNKGVIVTLIVVFSILALSLLGILFLFINGKGIHRNFLNITKVSTTKIFDEQYENTFKKISVDTNISDIEFKKSTDEKVRIIVYGEKKELTVDNTKDNLKIAFQEKSCIGICFNMKKSKVEVYLPETYNNKIMIKNDYGDIKIDHFKEATMEIEEDCGDVSVAGAKYIVVKNKYGNINIKEAKFANIEESCGDIEVRKVEDIIVKNNYGDIEIKNVLNYIDAEEDCGDIEIENLHINKNSRIKNSFGSINIGHTNEIYIDAKTDLGEVEIGRNFRTAKTTLTIKNNCGDIEIENN